MHLPINRIGEALKMGVSTLRDSDEPVRVSVFVDDTATPFLIDTIREAFVPQTTSAIVRVSRLSAGSTSVKSDTDISIVLTCGSADLQAAVQAIVVAGAPTVVVCESSVEAPFIQADTPMLGTSVAEYAGALGLEDFDGTVGGNISGTSDLVDLEAQAAIISELFPDAGTVGLLYCSGEPNSVYQIETVRGYLEPLGYACEIFAFTDVNDLASVTQAACDASDVIYIPTDNTVATNVESVANVVLPAGVPVVGGDPGICSGCGVATIATDYYELGRLTAEMAAQVLTGEADISSMPVQYGAMEKIYDPENCELLGISIPEGYNPVEG